MGGYLWEVLAPQSSHFTAEPVAPSQRRLIPLCRGPGSGWMLACKPFKACVSHYQPSHSRSEPREQAGRMCANPAAGLFSPVGTTIENTACCRYVLKQPRLNILSWSGDSASSILLQRLVGQRSLMCGPPWCSELFEQVNLIACGVFVVAL